MQKVHAKFTGKPGTLALFGDSITVTKAFWSPLAFAPKDLPAPLAKDLEVVKKHMLILLRKTTTSWMLHARLLPRMC